MPSKYCIEIYDLPTPQPEGLSIGYRIIGMDSKTELVTDADYLMHSLSETLSHIGLPMPLEAK